MYDRFTWLSFQFQNLCLWPLLLVMIGFNPTVWVSRGLGCQVVVFVYYESLWSIIFLCVHDV